MRLQRCIGAVLGLVSFLGVHKAQAQMARPTGFDQPTFNLQLFRPIIDSQGYVTVNASSVLGHLDFSVGLIGTWAYRPLQLTLAPGGGAALGRTFSVDHLATPQFQLTLGLFKRLEVGFSIPFTIMAGHRAACDSGTDNCHGWKGSLQDDLSFSKGSMGDLGLHIKGNILDVGRYPVGLALMASVYLPLSRWADGDGYKYLLAEDNVTLWPRVVLDREWGRSRRFRTGLNFGALIRFASQTFTDHGQNDVGGTTFCYPADNLSTTYPGCGTGLSRSAGTQLTYGLGASLAVIPGLLDVLGEFYGYADVAGNANDHPLEGLAALKLYLAPSSYIMTGLGGGLAGFSDSGKQTGGPAVRVFLGFIFEPGDRDRDGDGIPDRLDKCPDEPEDKDGFEDEDGCPDPDNDKDGIPDKLDKCPNDPETYNGYMDEDGCPDVAPEPNKPAPAAPTIGDRDGDGIPDNVDKCPDEPEDKDGFEDEDGCPDPDNDKDGIPDKLDKCPNEPETYNGYKDDDGCPDTPPKVVVTDTKVEILEKVYFDTAKATIKPVSYPILDEVAEVLKANLRLTEIEIQGHADERGNDHFNLVLTQNRAQAIKTYLMGKGVAGDRLFAKGYGETVPLCKEHTEWCWSRNRRVEFVILKRTDLAK